MCILKKIVLASATILLFVGCGVNDGHSGAASSLASDYLIEAGDVVERVDTSQEFRAEFTHFLDPDQVRVRGVQGKGQLTKSSGGQIVLAP